MSLIPEGNLCTFVSADKLPITKSAISAAMDPLILGMFRQKLVWPANAVNVANSPKQ